MRTIIDKWIGLRIYTHYQSKLKRVQWHSCWGQGTISPWQKVSPTTGTSAEKKEKGGTERNRKSREIEGGR